MKLLQYFKKQWNLIFGVSALIVAATTDVIIPPSFAVSAIEAQIDLVKLSKLIVVALILVLLIVFGFFKTKKMLLFYFPTSLLLMAVSCCLFFGYNDYFEQRSVYNTYSNERFIIGQKLLPFAQKAVDSVERLRKQSLSPEEMVERVGPPDTIWSKEEIRASAVSVLKYYMCTVTAIAGFLLFSMQSLYCLNNKSKRIRKAL